MLTDGRSEAATPASLALEPRAPFEEGWPGAARAGLLPCKRAAPISSTTQQIKLFLSFSRTIPFLKQISHSTSPQQP